MCNFGGRVPSSSWWSIKKLLEAFENVDRYMRGVTHSSDPSDLDLEILGRDTVEFLLGRTPAQVRQVTAFVFFSFLFFSFL